MGMKFSHLKPLTDAEEAAIQKQIAADSDAPEATDEQLALAKPFAEVFPDLAESIRRGRGRPSTGAAKAAVTLRLDRVTLEKFKATGKDWRARMSETLDKTKI